MVSVGLRRETGMGIEPDASVLFDRLSQRRITGRTLRRPGDRAVSIGPSAEVHEDGKEPETDNKMPETNAEAVKTAKYRRSHQRIRDILRKSLFPAPDHFAFFFAGVFVQTFTPDFKALSQIKMDCPLVLLVNIQAQFFFSALYKVQQTSADSL